MAVLREWRAEIRRELKDEYTRYVLETGIADRVYHYDSTVPGS